MMMFFAIFCAALLSPVAQAEIPSATELLYVPDTSDPGTPQDHGLPDAQSVQFKSKDGLTLYGWFQPPPSKEGRVIVDFPGNGGNIAGSAGLARSFLHFGYGSFLVEYPGYGKNPGTPSEAALYDDARAGIDWLLAHGYKAGDLILFGESLGTGVAVQMALEYHPRIVVLRSAFDSLADVMKFRYPDLPTDKIFADEKFDIVGKIPKVKAKLLFVHGVQDTLIPIRYARKAFDAANEPKEFLEIKYGGHNDLYEHEAGQLIMDWLDVQVTAEKVK